MGFLGTIASSLAEGFWMFYDTLWALVLGFALSGAVQAFVSKQQMQRALGDHRPKTIVRSSFFGMVSSSCSYAASALAKSLFVRGADFTSSMVFMFASTNLVVELGAVLWLLIGWQFAVAEFIGGFIMIALLALILPRVIDVAALDAARERLRTGSARSTAHEEHAGAGAPTATSWRRRIASRAGWSDASGYTISDVTMLRKELVIGFVVAGFASVAVPTGVWKALFLTGHGIWSALENVIVGPVLAFISFVCSVGNVPLAAALWKGGISFGGVIAFVFADLLALPLVLIYRKFYGTRLALRLSLVFWAVMSLAGLITEGIFTALGLVPGTLIGDIATVHFGLNYTTILDILAVIVFGYLYYLYKNAAKFGGGGGYAKDPVCGMQVRTADAPAHTTHQGHDYYFCSDKCHDTFEADPAKYTDGQPAPVVSQTAPAGPMNADAGAAVTDPVCGMSIDPHTAAGHATHDGVDYSFCSENCRKDFVADPAHYLTPTGSGGPRADPDDARTPATDPVARLERNENKEDNMVENSQKRTDPVCGMGVDPATAAANVEHDGTTYYFCSTGCATTFTADPHTYASATTS
ncbi:MAG: permease [Cellulomonas sp.]